VSDICDTLFYSNTTFDFIRFCAEKGWLGNKGKRTWRTFLRRQSLPFWALAVLNKVTGADLHKKVAVGLLKGHNVTEVSGWAAQFYQEYLAPRKVAQTFAVLQQLAGDTLLVLASSSIEPVVAEVAKAVGASQYVATTLETSEGVYTGRIEQELTGKKTDALKELLQRGIPVAVLSDNTTDRALMELAENGYAICYNDVQRKFWSTVPRINLLDVKSKVA
jgi:phosphoserine phosphatase